MMVGFESTQKPSRNTAGPDRDDATGTEAQHPRRAVIGVVRLFGGFGNGSMRDSPGADKSVEGQCSRISAGGR